MDLSKHIWEGWRVQDFIDALEPQLAIIQAGNSWKDKIVRRKELKLWCMENQPYYKKYIPEVVEYFESKYKFK